MTTAEQLAQINAAITTIETTGQEYRINNRTLKRADLAVLYKERRELQAQLASESGYTTTVVSFVGR